MRCSRRDGCSHRGNAAERSATGKKTEMRDPYRAGWVFPDDAMIIIQQHWLQLQTCTKSLKISLINSLYYMLKWGLILIQEN